MNKKSKILSIIFLVILFITCIIENYVDHFNSNFIIKTILYFIIIGFLGILVPFIIKTIKKEKLSVASGRLICFLNSFYMLVISIIIIPEILDSAKVCISGIIGALVFYFINSWLFIDETKEISDKELYKKTFTIIIIINIIGLLIVLIPSVLLK